MSWRKGRATEAKGELEKEGISQRKRRATEASGELQKEEGKRGDKLQKEGEKEGLSYMYTERGGK